MALRQLKKNQLSMFDELGTVFYFKTERCKIWTRTNFISKSITLLHKRNYKECHIN